MWAERTSSKEERQLDPSMWLERHGDYLFRYAMFRLRDSDAAEDAVQETMLAALQAHRAYEGRGSERTWLVGILKHKIIDHYRRVSRARAVSPGDSERDDEFDPFEKTDQWAGHWRADLAPTEWQLDASTFLESKEFWETFDRCLLALPERTAMAFTLREIDGLSSEEICDVLNVSPNNLGVMLHRARLKLRSSLETEWFRNQPRGSERQPGVGAKPNYRTGLPGIHRALKFVGLAA
ncbi:MAG TPA: sigma-70 family RNA polymerase sigma factor [Pyrinomonadaceae bacterium]|nr:sigma-70 family RNA polymerase sigma factor [Pyrinomonadaceae bacterium]